MYKLISGVALFAFCFLLGRYFSAKKSKKAAFYSALCDFNANFINELNFSRKKISELLVPDYSSKNFNALILIVKQKKCEQNALCLKNELSGEWQNELDLSDGQISEIENYFSFIGSSDALSQESECLRYSELFKKQLAESEKGDKTLGSLYKKLGFIIGLIAFVVVL